MSLIKKIQRWWRDRQFKPPLNDMPDSEAAQRDLGVSVIRIRLPSGHEIIIVESQGED